MSIERVAIVTGSTSGIGEATAQALSGAGYAVVINSATSRSAGEALAGRLPNATYVQADIANAADAQRLVDEAMRRHGRLDTLINNAGVTVPIAHSDLDAVTSEVWHRILNVNVIGTWQITTAAAAVMSAGSHIINITSTAGSRPVGSSIPYAVSKAALNHMTRLLATALGPDLQVNAIAPGLIDTPWTAEFVDAATTVRDRAPLRRIGQPVEIAAAVLGLLGSPYITGEVIHVDGGAHLL